MKKIVKCILPIVSSAALAAPVMVSCGETSKADFVCNDRAFGGGELASKRISVEPNKTYTVSIDLSKLGQNKIFSGYKLHAACMGLIEGQYFYFDPELCQVKIDNEDFKKAVIGTNQEIIIDKEVTFSKIEFIVGFQQQRHDAYLTFIDNPGE